LKITALTPILTIKLSGITLQHISKHIKMIVSKISHVLIWIFKNISQESELRVSKQSIRFFLLVLFDDCIYTTHAILSTLYV